MDNGVFVWHELRCRDGRGAERFYTELFGWTTSTWETPEAGRATLFCRDNRVIAGMAEVQQATSVWVPYIGVDDVDDLARKARELGGRALRAPDDIPGIGRYAVMEDPEGALFAIYRASAR